MRKFWFHLWLLIWINQWKTSKPLKLVSLVDILTCNCKTLKIKIFITRLPIIGEYDRTLQMSVIDETKCVVNFMIFFITSPNKMVTDYYNSFAQCLLLLYPVCQWMSPVRGIVDKRLYWYIACFSFIMIFWFMMRLFLAACSPFKYYIFQFSCENIIFSMYAIENPSCWLLIALFCFLNEFAATLSHVQILKYNITTPKGLNKLSRIRIWVYENESWGRVGIQLQV